MNLTNTSVNWLLNGKRVRAITGTVTEHNGDWLTVTVTATERKKDAKLVGTKMMVPVEMVQ